MYYLISNDIFLTKEKIDSISFDKEDIIVLFNHAKPLGYKKILNHKNKIIFLRMVTENNYHGLNYAIKNKEYYSKIILVNSNKISNSILQSTQSAILVSQDEIKNIVSLNFKLNNSSKSYTTGFIATIYLWYHIKELNNICLVNFTAGSSILNKKPWFGHDYEFEQQFYRNHNICMI